VQRRAEAAPYPISPCRGRQSRHRGSRLSHAAAIEACCTTNATGTGEPVGEEPNPALANMLRCGFERVGLRLNYEAAG
jgi:hypothetical protein